LPFYFPIFITSYANKPKELFVIDEHMQLIDDRPFGIDKPNTKTEKLILRDISEKKILMLSGVVLFEV